MAPPPAAATAWEPDSWAAPPGVVQLLLRNIDSRTTVVRAQREDTVDSLLGRLGGAVASKGGLRVVYGGRDLPREATVGELGLPPDATLHVTSRLLSTPHPDSWNLASEVAAAARLAATGGQPAAAASVDQLVRDFCLNASRHARGGESTSPLGPVADHLSIFLRSNAAGVLGQLYLSEHAECRAGAERAIRRFLPPLFTLPEHGIAKVWTAPVLLEFCCAIAAGARQADTLYADLRRALAAILVVPEWEPACWLDMPPELVAAQLTRFVADTANAVTAHIGGAYGSSAEANKHLAEFKAFSTALRRQLPEPPDAHGPWRTALYETLVSLLRSAEEFMAMFDMSLASSSSSARLRWTTSVPLVWTVLLELDAWSEIEYAWPELRGALRATLAAHDAATGALVMGVDGTEWTQSAGSWIARHRDLLGFEARRHLAMTMLPKLAAAVGGHKMLVDRSRLLSDSFGSIAHATPEKLRAGLSVEFKHEYATGPGVRREWFCMVLQALFNQRQVLFSACPSDRRRFFVNPTSVVDPLHLPYYQFAGRMIALALMHNIPVGVLFDRTLFLLLAARPVTLDDIADADPSLHANCKKILEMDPSLVDSNLLGLTFVRETELLGSRTVTELISGGKDTIVNSENRSNYIHLLIQDRFVNCTRDQLAYFSLGFNSMFGRRELPKYFFEALDVEDFNQMLGGSKDTIDVKEWRAHTDYNGYRETSRRVKWFWKVVKAMTVEQQRLLLFFWTSVKYLPFDGFSGLGSRLSIFRSPNSCDHLPTSGTCFYKLNLPAYTSYDMMQSRLQMIAQEHVSSGFGKS